MKEYQPMSSVATFCPTCGNALDPASGQECPHCAAQATSEQKRWGAGTGLLIWLASVLLIFGFQIIAAGVYIIIKIVQTGKLPQTFEVDWLIAVLSVAVTFPAHLLTLLICWLVVTERGKRRFWEAIGWGWHPQFKWVHAVGLAFLMMGVAFLLEKFLPHKETDLEKLLKMGTAVRVLIAALAVLTAPLVEEVVYRGVLYTGIENVWGKIAGIALVTFLFALVHVPQYWGSYAAITAIVSLSLVLTLLRAATGKLLPCVATHLVYNAVQAVALLAAPDKMPEISPTKQALIMACKLLGIG